ncbi:hypothetical protein BDW02DRAFT_286764 [Decorospora gaudefroyi]|uniref:Uncharacterized protein n=1 Tax=Decorospora gaudefroyi TaxID=184978 RepID=A0A6A5KME9_9PLEO|nr:hypothetical protein BDW02DRAFT_286764 [Decorospora gaudefroyi]
MGFVTDRDRGAVAAQQRRERPKALTTMQMRSSICWTGASPSAIWTRKIASWRLFPLRYQKTLIRALITRRAYTGVVLLYMQYIMTCVMSLALLWIPTGMFHLSDLAPTLEGYLQVVYVTTCSCGVPRQCLRICAPHLLSCN